MDAKKRCTLLVIAGPTGSGKSALALELAQKLNGEIFSVDSVQFYRGMDIGSAKVSRAEREQIPHHGIDICNLNQAFDVQSFIDYTIPVLSDLENRQKLAIIAGGSGFYLQSFYRTVTDGIKISPRTESQLESLSQAGEMALREAFLAINPDGGGIDLKNSRRVRAHLARCLETGLSAAALRQNMQAQRSPLQDYRKFTVLLQWDREKLKKRLEERLQKMLKSGLIKEVQKLRQEGLELNRSTSNAIGYRQTLNFLNGKLTRETLSQEILQKNNELVRKQYNWFRHKIPIDITFNPEIDRAENIIYEFKKFINSQQNY